MSNEKDTTQIDEAQTVVIKEEEIINASVPTGIDEDVAAAITESNVTDTVAPITAVVADKEVTKIADATSTSLNATNSSDAAKKSLLSIVVGRGNGNRDTDDANHADIDVVTENHGGSDDRAQLQSMEEEQEAVFDGTAKTQSSTKNHSLDATSNPVATVINYAFGNREVKIPEGPEKALSIISWTDLERVVQQKLLIQAVQMYTAMMKTKKYRSESSTAVALHTIKRCGSPPWMDSRTIIDAFEMQQQQRRTKSSHRNDNTEAEWFHSLELLAAARKKAMSASKLSTKAISKNSSHGRVGRERNRYSLLDSGNEGEYDDSEEDYTNSKHRKKKKQELRSPLPLGKHKDLEDKAVHLYLRKQAELPDSKKNLPKNAMEDILTELGLSSILKPSHVYNALRRHRRESEEKKTKVTQRSRVTIFKKAIGLYQQLVLEAQRGLLTSNNEAEQEGAIDHGVKVKLESTVVADAESSVRAELNSTTETTPMANGDANADLTDSLAFATGANYDGATEVETIEATGAEGANPAVSVPSTDHGQLPPETKGEYTQIPDEAVVRIIEQLDASDWITVDAIRNGDMNKCLNVLRYKKTPDSLSLEPLLSVERLSIAEKKMKVEEASILACTRYMEARQKAHPLRVKESDVHKIIISALSTVGLTKRFRVLITPQTLRARIFRIEAEEERKKRVEERSKRNMKRQQEEDEIKKLKKQRLSDEGTTTVEDNIDNNDNDNSKDEVSGLEQVTVENAEEIAATKTENDVILVPTVEEMKE